MIGDVEPILETNKEAAAKKSRIKQGIISAYEAYSRREPGSMDALMEKVREFAYMKVYHLEYDFRTFGSAETADDWAQEITLKVWLALEQGNFKGTGASFYAWVHKIAFNQATDAFKSLEKDKKKFTTITVTKKGDDEEDYEDDNPEIYNRSDRGEFHTEVPDWVEGIDRWLWTLMGALSDRDGTPLTYAEIGTMFTPPLTERKVIRRVQKMRKRATEEKTKADAKRKSTWAAKEAERRGSVGRGLEALRKQVAAEADRAKSEKTVAP